ncbi:MAG: Re/Si-specific NAD(P)(+) transhydrogenase subunit alpha [Alphaproteobacteria bacterium]|nr:Re/Si-specific NAD(P)(+) transhydrogenase subunit alpha [Alphaproteobacteria bacterium]
MKIAVLKERRADEARVAATPETVKKFKGLGADVAIEAGAGAASHFSDADYTAAGAVVVADAAKALEGADVVLKVQRPTEDELSAIPKGAMLAAVLAPYANRDEVKALAAKGVNAFAMEFMPRITRAQSMDVLSSQSNLAGYKAVIDAAAAFGRAFPMMMTAAGTIAPARVFIMGVGVAGLQAIATAKRLGAIVSATDVRAATKEQVQSLGGTFVMVEDDESKAAETSAGYAKEMSDAYKQKQAALIAETIKKQDIVITTALIPGRPAPVLVTEAMVKTMKPGSIIVDLATEQGGNCPLSKAGQVVDVGGVRIIGTVNLAGKLAADASSLYSRNLFNFLSPLIDKTTKSLKIDWNDEIIKGTCLTRDGDVVHPALKG